MTDEKPYVLGHSSHEIRRLELQAEVLRPPSNRLLRAVGLSTGMSVLDIGTGAGDVAMLAAEIVGPEGVVVGIDRNAAVIDRARERARAAGLAHLRFETGDFVEAGSLGLFDRVVGRFVLPFQRDQPAFLRRAAARVKRGGALAFLEPMFLRTDKFSSPPAPLFDTAIAQCIDGFEAGGADVAPGGQLASLFRNAGLNEPDMFSEMPMGGPSSPISEWISATLESLTPALQAAGKLDAIDFSTHAGKLREEALRSSSQLFGPRVVGASTRIG